MKKIVSLILTLVFIICFGITSFAYGVVTDYINDGPGAAKWEQESNGKWMYKMGETPYTNKLVYDYNTKNTYYFNEKGYMSTGYYMVDGQTYYLTEVESEGHPLGSLLLNGTTPEGLTTNDKGVVNEALPWRVNPYHYDSIEVVIPEQAVYVYLGEKLVASTPCVTGKVSTGTITPTGDFAIQAKMPDKTLKGENVDGSKYESFVKYWMPFLTFSYGLHDASWRKNFGGQIYLTGGSHGCVNLPSKAAEQIYNICYVGMPVHVHE